MKYEYRRFCKCGNIDFIGVTKFEAAFELNCNSILNRECSKCGGKKVWSIGIENRPKIDKELLTNWLNNPSYFFCKQDEDLMLAQYKENIDLYIEFIDKTSVPKNKKNILINSLCVMIYDRAKKRDNKEEKEIIKKISFELKKRENQLISAQYCIMDYIKNISFPIIGIEYKASNKLKLEEETYNNFLESVIQESNKNNLQSSKNFKEKKENQSFKNKFLAFFKKI